MSATVLLWSVAPYLEASLLLVFAAVVTKGLSRLGAGGKLPFSFRTALRLSRGLLWVSLCLPALMPAIPRGSLLRPSAQVWSGSARGATSGAAVIRPWGTPQGETALPSSLTVSPETILLFVGLLALGMLFFLAVWVRDLRRLRRHLASLPVIRRVGRVRVLATDDDMAPFSARVGRDAYVVIPTAFLARPGASMLALRHELQHHRQGDTVAVHGIRILQAIFFWNPALRVLLRHGERLQEFACDESLVGRRGIDAEAYGRCLLWAAETVVHARPALAGVTTSMALCVDGTTLKRRIHMLFPRKKIKGGGALAFATAVAALLLMTSLAYGAHSLVQPKALSLNEAEALANGARRIAEIPIDMNPKVLEKLNRYVGTVEGKRWLEEAFYRMRQYRPMIESLLRDRRLPLELLAVPLWESGFRNDVVSPPPARAAGIWQFIPQTARRYDLIVRPDRDDRLVAELATLAAARYLEDLFARFQDWRLALKAYNEGEQRVEALIAKVGTKDPWALEAVASSEGYLPGVIAMMLLLKYPSLAVEM